MSAGCTGYITNLLKRDSFDSLEMSGIKRGVGELYVARDEKAGRINIGILSTPKILS